MKDGRNEGKASVEIVQGHHSFKGHSKEKVKDRIGLVGRNEGSNNGVGCHMATAFETGYLKSLVIGNHENDDPRKNQENISDSNKRNMFEIR